MTTPQEWLRSIEDHTSDEVLLELIERVQREARRENERLKELLRQAVDWVSSSTGFFEEARRRRDELANEIRRELGV